MNVRYLKRFLLLVAGFAVVWLFWPRQAVKPAAVLPKPAAAKPAVTVVSTGKTPASLFLAAKAGTNAVAGGRSTNKFALRLTNTTKTLGQLSHDAHAILLANALIDTRASLDLKIPNNLKAKGDPGAYIVQANGNTTPAFRAMLAAAGGQIISYIPNNAYLVRATADEVAAMTGSGLVAAVLPYEPYYKVSAGLLAQAVAQPQQPLAADAILNLGVYSQDAAATEAAFDAVARLPAPAKAGSAPWRDPNDAKVCKLSYQSLRAFSLGAASRPRPQRRVEPGAQCRDVAFVG